MFSSCIFGIWLSTDWRSGLAAGKAATGNAAKAAPASAPWMNSRRLNAILFDSVNASPFARTKMSIRGWPETQFQEENFLLFIGGHHTSSISNDQQFFYRRQRDNPGLSATRKPLLCRLGV